MLSAGLITSVVSSCWAVTPTPLPEPIVGSYEVKYTNFTGVHGMDETDPNIDVWYPKSQNGEQFPLALYLHGYSRGGADVYNSQRTFLSALSAFGYVVVAPRACSTGCSDGATDYWLDPPGFKNFFNQQLLAIEWATKEAKAGDDVLKNINLDLGVAILGHSMGAQASEFTGSNSSAIEKYNISAAALIHTFTHSYNTMKLPYMIFTGDADTLASPDMTHQIWNKQDTFPVRALVNKKGQDHSEVVDLPDKNYNPNLAMYVASWFKLYVDGIVMADGNNYHDLIYGNGSLGLCSGGDGELTECEVHDGMAVV